MFASFETHFRILWIYGYVVVSYHLIDLLSIRIVVITFISQHDLIVKHASF